MRSIMRSKQTFFGVFISLFLLLLFVWLSSCATNGKIESTDIAQMTPMELQAIASSTCVLIGQLACAIKPEVAPPAKAVLDTVVTVNGALSGEAANAEDMEEWVSALQRSAELVKKRSFQKHVSNLMIILKGRGLLDQSLNVVDLSRFDSEELDEIMGWVQECADSMSIGLSDCVDGGVRHD